MNASTAKAGARARRAKNSRKGSATAAAKLGGMRGSATASLTLRVRPTPTSMKAAMMGNIQDQSSKSASTSPRDPGTKPDSR